MGAILAGYKNVIYVASDDNEMTMMTMPLEIEEKNINYDEHPPALSRLLVHLATHDLARRVRHWASGVRVSSLCLSFVPGT